MSLDSVRQATYDYLAPRFAAKTTASIGSVPDILMPNESEPDLLPFIKISFLETAGHNAAIGGTLKRKVGVVHVDVLTDKDTGSRESNLICDAVSDSLENVKISLGNNEYLTYYIAHSQPMGEEHGKYRQVVRIPYIRDTVTL